MTGGARFPKNKVENNDGDQSRFVWKLQERKYYSFATIFEQRFLIGLGIFQTQEGKGNPCVTH